MERTTNEAMNETMNELELNVTKKQGGTYRVNEITERRGERSRVFRMSDGSEQAEYCFAPIHVYNEETKEFEKIDRTLKADSSGTVRISTKAAAILTRVSAAKPKADFLQLKRTAGFYGLVQNRRLQESDREGT